MVNTPVLFETFARPQYARQVFDAIKANKPKKLYFYSNKARADRPEEIKNNEVIRSWAKEVDWDCELHTFFREEYVDVYTSLNGALDWVFKNEPEAIILEDDCVPTSAFFSFCDQMVEKFRDEKNVWCISGDNYLDYKPEGADFFFSQYHFMFGWASWRDRWEQIIWDNLDIASFIRENVLAGRFKTNMQLKKRYKELSYIKEKVDSTHCWDYAFGFAIDLNKGVTVHPKEHLVTCVGMLGAHSQLVEKSMFDIEANPSSSTYLISLDNKLIAPDKQYDYLFFKKFERYQSLTSRIRRFIKREIKRFFNK